MQIVLSPPATGLVLTHAVTVTTGSTQAIGTMRNRLSLTFHNPGTVDVYICQDSQAATVAGAGMCKVEAGKYFEIDAPGGGGWNCIAASSAVLTILESTFFMSN